MTDRELDALVAKARGTPHRKPVHGRCCTCQICGWPNDNECQCGYVEDMGRAWGLVEELKARHGVSVSGGPDDEGGCEHWVCHVKAFGYRPLLDLEWRGEADIAPRAICIAYLKAKGVEVPEVA